MPSCISLFVDEATVIAMYEWFIKSVASVGSRVSKPRCSDVRKTYQFRSVNKFVSDMNDAGIDTDQMQILIKEMVKYAKDKKILRRGISILNMPGVLKACLDRIKLKIESSDLLFNEIESASKLINGKPLHAPQELGGYSRLTCMINKQQIPIELVAISKLCMEAMQKMDRDERQMHLPDTELLRIRVRLLINKCNHDKFKKILGNDLLTAGVPQ